MNQFFNEDCTVGANKIPSNSVDLIITDPPFAIEGDKLHKHYNRDESNVISGYIEIPKSEYPDFSQKWINQAARILKKGGSMYIISGYTNLYDILHALRQTSLEEINHIIWKYNFGVCTKQKYVSSHYHILFYKKKGKHKFNLEARYPFERVDGKNPNYLDREDVWIINREYKRGKTKNKNELPTELVKKMIAYSSNENDVICDFFCGGFTIPKIAISMNRNVIGFEKSSEIFNANIDRINKISPAQSQKNMLNEFA